MKQKSTFLKVFMTLLLLMGVSSVWAQATWTLVTSVDELTAGGTFVLGYKGSGDGQLIPLRSVDCNAKTSANGYFNTGVTDNSSTNGQINIKTATDLSKYEIEISASTNTSGAVNIKIKDGFIGATSNGGTKNSGRLYSTGNSNETNLTPSYDTSKGFSFVANVTGGYKYLKYNTGSPRFAFYNSNGDGIVIYKKGTASSVANPTFSVASGSYANTQSVELSCATEGATIYYTIDGSDPTSSSTEYSTAITVSKSTTIKAIAIKGEEKSNVVSASYKITTYANVADLVADGEPTKDGSPVTVTLANEVIKSFYTSSGYRNGIYLNYTNPADNYIEIYCKNVPDDWVAGGTVSGTLENCTWKNYNGTWELCPEDWDDLTYTAPATYAINIDNAIANGTVAASATESAAGLEVSLTVTPADHYELVSLSVKDKADNDIPVTDNKFTMPASDVTVSATFAEKTKFTVSYNALGEDAGSEEVYDGELIVAAPTPTLAGWELIGWTTNDAYETSTTAPTAFELSTPITEDLTLYAVFQKTIGEGGKYVLDYDVDVKEETLGYGSAVNVTAADGSEWIVKAYKNTGMQINTGKDASIKIPNCSSNITSIEIACTVAKAVGLSAEDYTGSGTISYIATGSDATSQTLDCSGTSVTGGYIVAKSGSTSITKIVVNYGNATTTYTITGPEFKTVTISEVGYATYSSDKALVVPSDETVFGAKINETGTAVTLLPVEAGTVIEAGTGFIVAGNGSVTFEVSAAAGEPIADNELLGTGNETLDLEAGDAYLLGAKDGKAVFALCNEGTLGANKACLPAPSTVGANSTLGFDDATGIISVNNDATNNGAIYNLNGQKVGAGYKGIVIVNGKKMFNK